MISLMTTICSERYAGRINLRNKYVGGLESEFRILNPAGSHPLTLPDEVLRDIFTSLNWKTLLAIKLTCTRTHTIVKSLWACKSSELSLKLGSPVLEGPAEDYSVEELERKLIRQLQIEERWCNPDPTGFRLRKLNVRLMSHHRGRILPGGRWFLDNADGCVYVLDLNKPDPAPQILFEEKRCTATGVVDRLSGDAIWIDSSKPWLSFRIALHRDTLWDFNTQSRICIYQLDFGCPHAGTAWDVKPMVTLMCPGSFYKKGLQLGGDYVVERCIHENGDARAWKVHLFQYSGSFPRVCVWEYERAETIIPLPGNRLVVLIHLDSDLLVDFFNIRTLNDSRSLALEPSFRLSSRSGPITSTSQLLADQHFSYLITACKGSLNALQIPHDNAVSPLLKQFHWDPDEGDYDGGYLTLGLSRMVVLRRDDSLDFIAYDLRGDQFRVESRVSVPPFLPNFESLVYRGCDGGSGRILLENSRSQMCSLLEI